MNLCDTNVISELTRREPSDGVLAWAAGVRTIAISVVTLDEIVFGLSWKPIPRIAAWFEEFLERHCEVLPVSTAVARVSGQLRGRLRAAGQSRSQADMLIAATAKVHGLTLVTRNVRDFEGCSLPLFNPFGR